MLEWVQRATYEASATFGPQWSALAAGYAVLIGGRMFLTDAGERYLDSLVPDFSGAEAVLVAC